MVEVYKFISRVADADSTVLLQGETGTGKERVARLIHESGARRAARFVAVDCGAMAASLLEGELFGSLRGAFTGADRDRTGLLESADGGTVFFDEIGEMELGFQQRLLRFLQEREVRPLGSASARKVDVRVIAASNRDLRQLVSEKKFREDLWYRLQVACFTLAPLRERSEDIPLLVEHFLEALRQRLRPVHTPERCRLADRHALRLAGQRPATAKSSGAAGDSRSRPGGRGGCLCGGSGGIRRPAERGREIREERRCVRFPE